jgi:hypothetical protein
VTKDFWGSNIFLSIFVVEILFNMLVMNTKLTLNIEQTIIEKATQYAKGQGRSLSEIIENYLRVIAKKEEKPEIEITPIVKSLKGSFNAPSDFDYKMELSNRLSAKYL